MKREYSPEEAERILKKVGALPDDVAVITDMTIHQDRDTGEWTPKGRWNLEGIADLRVMPGKAVLKAGTKITKDNVPEEVWDAWIKSKKIAPRFEVRLITTERELKNIIRLIYTTKETDIYALTNLGGFNVKKNHNDPGVQTKEPVDPSTSEDAKKTKTPAKAPAKKRGRPTNAEKEEELRQARR